MRMVDIIQKKRNGMELSKEEIDFFITEYTKGNIPDYQASALLMAIYFQKMSKRETADLTMAMMHSGDRIDLSFIQGIKVDKHSTGGVGDTTTLVLAPLVAAAGVPVAKMSGRGLGHTGGTVDKLESFPGFSVEISNEQFIKNVNENKIAVAGQSSNLAPADKKLYALRDVTATVENISLIASSIMSKKLAAGADGIVLDVKTGNGAFMKEEESAFLLAKEMVDIGTYLNKDTIAVITDMEQPLGNAIGNVLEVKEAIDTLNGNGPKDLEELCLVLGAQMLVIGKKATSFEEGKDILKKLIRNKEGLNKLKQLIVAQGGDTEVIDDVRKLPQAAIIHEVKAGQKGYIEKIQADQIGIAAMILGAGRETKESKIDLSVGIVLNKKIGDFVLEDEAIAIVYANDTHKCLEAEKLILQSYSFSQHKTIPPKLIKGIVTKNNRIKYE